MPGDLPIKKEGVPRGWPNKFIRKFSGWATVMLEQVWLRVPAKGKS